MAAQKLCWHRRRETVNHQVRHLLATMLFHADLRHVLNYSQKTKSRKIRFKFVLKETSVIATT